LFFILEFPEVILNIEKEELGISAGLQDRVIQTYGGLVHMDFTRDEQKTTNIYTELDPSLLPPLYLIYNTSAGGDSGKVHSTVKERWNAKDPSLIEGMQTIGRYADEAVSCLHEKNYTRLGELMEANFQMRRNLYSDAVVGSNNVIVSKVAKNLGLSVKFTGSGGAFVGVRSDGKGWLSEIEEKYAREKFHEHQFEFIRIEIPPVEK
jgi:glucuronokinase